MDDREREGFVREMELHLNAMYNFARWLTEGNDQAEDVVHEALARALANWNQYRPGTQMKAWLFTIVRRTYLNRLRRGKYEVNSAEYPERDDLLPSRSQEGMAGALPRGLVRRDLDAALASLPEEQRALVLLADMEDVPLQEIAGIMDMPLGTVKSRLWRARRVLREKMIGYREQLK